MEHYDVIIVGAGPAGGQCARELSASGKRVLLIEKAKSFAIKNYSSGGSNLSVLDDFKIPSHVIATRWNRFAIHTTNDRHLWESESPAGVVFDFMKLRQFLADETATHGGIVRLGVSYHHHEEIYGKTVVHLKNHNTRQTESIVTDVIVDATGSERKVLVQDEYDKSRAMCSTGIEFLLKVHPDDYSAYANTLTAFLGTKWMPQGYAWIFPMGENRLKVGVIRYFQHDQIVPHEQSYAYYLDQLINHAFVKPHDILDKHGKTLYYTYSRKDLHFKNNVIAIGDAVSMLNPLAAEGIRHGLYSGHKAAQAVLAYLNGDTKAFKAYQTAMTRYCGFKWTCCEWIMHIVYKSGNDRRFALFLNTLRTFDFNGLMDLLFRYDISKFFTFTRRLGSTWVNQVLTRENK